MEPLKLVARWSSENNQSTTLLCLTSKAFSDIPCQLSLKDIPENNWRCYVEHYGANIQKLVLLVAAQGNLSFFKELICEPTPSTWWDFNFDWSDPFRVAAKNGHIPILEWIFSQGHVRRDTLWIYECAARTGQVHVLQWLRDNSFDLRLPLILVQEALSVEQIPALEWIFTTFWNDLQFRRCDYRALLKWAALQNKLQAAKLAMDKNTKPLLPLKFVCSPQFNQKTINYCQERGAPWIIEIRPQITLAQAMPVDVDLIYSP